MMSEIEIIKEVYAAINRNDIAAALSFFDSQMERIEPEGFPSSGTYRGYQEVLDHFTKGRSTWAEGGCHPEDIQIFGSKIVVNVHIHVRLKDHIQWIDAHIADGFIFKGEKIIQMRSFLKNSEALFWAESKS